ncbi:MAG: hypothetical protein HY319_13570 [Armatimonadetes bacterium]|nr:hypothetical protein [Armatimonadota bacterium]
MEESVQNVYLDEVLEQQVRVDQELKRKAAPPTPPLLSRGRRQAPSSFRAR